MSLKTYNLCLIIFGISVFIILGSSIAIMILFVVNPLLKVVLKEQVTIDDAKKFIEIIKISAEMESITNTMEKFQLKFNQVDNLYIFKF